MKKKAFTLIELIAVLVILAILALIVTPLVMSIIKKAKDSANKRSVDGYGRALELAVSEYSLDTGKYPTSLDMVEPKYKGNKVICNVRLLKENGDVYLSECKVNGKDVKDSKTDDGWYHYGEKILSEINYVDMYGKALEKSIKEYYDTKGALPLHLNLLDTKYTGKDIKCDVSINFDITVYMTKCIVDNVEITDNKTEDGYYHYGLKKKKGQEYVDDYGQAIELAVANYYAENSEYPSDINSLEINYNGVKLNCNDMIINNDGTVFLNECSANDVFIKTEAGDGYYRYGRYKKLYKIGDIVTYDDIDFYVIKDSGVDEENVTILKKTPLTVAEVNEYGGVGTLNNHVNQYTSSYNGTASYQNGYGGVQYYGSSGCGYSGSWNTYNCITDYKKSQIKYIVDAWKDDKIPLANEARLIRYDELFNDLGYNNGTPGVSWINVDLEYIPSWLYSNDYAYWTMSPHQDNSSYIWRVGKNGYLSADSPHTYETVVRPVISIKKELLKR